jgi:hypothetical protein
MTRKGSQVQVLYGPPAQRRFFSLCSVRIPVGEQLGEQTRFEHCAGPANCPDIRSASRASLWKAAQNLGRILVIPSGRRSHASHASHASRRNPRRRADRGANNGFLRAEVGRQHSRNHSCGGGLAGPPSAGDGSGMAPGTSSGGSESGASFGGSCGVFEGSVVVMPGPYRACSGCKRVLDQPKQHLVRSSHGRRCRALDPGDGEDVEPPDRVIVSDRACEAGSRRSPLL